MGYTISEKEVKNKIAYVLKNCSLEIITPFIAIGVDMEFKCSKCHGIFKRKPRVFLKT